MFEEKIGVVCKYQLEVMSTNQTIVVPLCCGSIQMFSASIRENTDNYFDLCLYTDRNECLNYFYKEIGPYVHSGDTHAMFGGGFLHTITITNNDRAMFFLNVTGYNKTPLHLFAKHTPSVCVVNHDTRTVYIVPCPLDIMSMGHKGDFAILAKGTIENNTIKLTILPRPIIREGMNTGQTNSVTANAINEAKNTNVISQTPSRDQTSQIEDEFMMDFAEPDVLAQQEHVLLRGEPVVVVQHMYNVPTELENLKRYYFGSTISETDNMSQVILPIAGGSVVMGDNILVHAKTSKVDNYKNILNSSSFVVIVVGEEMANSLIDKCQTKVNALFIVTPLNQTGNVIDIMDSMCINAVTAMAGPCSLVLTHIENEYYFYRGINWPRFIENASYGDKVTENMKNLNIDTSSYPWPFVANMDEIYFKNDKIAVADVEQINFVEAELPAVKDVVCQLQIIMSPEKLQKIQTAIIGIIIKNENDLRQSPQVKQMIKEKRFSEIKKYINDVSFKFKTCYKDIVSLLQNTISLQKSSSKKYDLNRLMRKEVISANVKEAESQSMGEMIDNLCTTMGTISCLINNTLMRDLLKHLRDGPLVDWLKKQDTKYLTNVTNICPRMTILDGTTTSALLENDKNNSFVCPQMSITNIYERDDHPFVGSPYGMPEYASIMFLPLHDKTYEDPYAVSWPNEANDKKVALLRIKMRSIVAEAMGNEEAFRTSKEVNYTIIYLYFCILEKLTENVTPSNDEDSMVRNISRAIISSILCAASSGQSPLPLYQIASYNTSIVIPDCSVWWMYFKLRTLWKYTGWDQTIIDRKFKHFIVKSIRKHVVDSVTNNLRRTNKQYETIKKYDRWAKKNIELEWLRTAIPSIRNNKMPSPYENEVTTRGGAIINRYLKDYNYEHVIDVCDDIELNDWKIIAPEQAELEWLRTVIPSIRNNEMPSPCENEVTTPEGVIINKYLKNYKYVISVCDNIERKRSHDNWKIAIPKHEKEHEFIDKRINIRNLPEMDQFTYTLPVFKKVVRVLYDHHMNIEESEEMAIQLLYEEEREN